MWSNKYFKLSAVLCLVIFINLAKGEGVLETTTTDSSATTNSGENNPTDSIAAIHTDNGVDGDQITTTKSLAEVTNEAPPNKNDESEVNENSPTKSEAGATTESLTSHTEINGESVTDPSRSDNGVDGDQITTTESLAEVTNEAPPDKNDESQVNENSPTKSETGATMESLTSHTEINGESVTDPSPNVESATESTTETEADNNEESLASYTESNSESVTDPSLNVESATESTTETEADNNEESLTSHTESGHESVTEPSITAESATESSTESEADNNGVSVTVAESITESTTDQIDCICDCTANGNQVKLECSTQAPEETQTTENSENDIASNTVSNGSETDSTKPTLEETSNKSNDNLETNTAESNQENVSTTISDANENPETTTESKTEQETTTPAPACSTPGLQPHANDCQQYYDCSLEGSLDGGFHLLSKSCPDKQAFNTELNRCSRDISSCSNPVECLVKGGVADPASNNSYYLCEPRLIGQGFRIFYIECSANELFYPELGKCFLDFNNLPSQIYPPFNTWNQIEDIDIVKAELKLLKEQDKLKLKQEKDRIKAEEKLQKELEKEAKKRAKEEEKANKEKAKQEAASFVCSQEGNFASPVSESTYFACISKKGKFKAVVMQCPVGSKFNGESGTCVNSPPKTSGIDTDDDDDEDD